MLFFALAALFVPNIPEEARQAAVGVALLTAGLFWLSFLKYDSPYLTHVLPAMVLMSVGMAFVFIPTASTALHGVGHHDAGVASALINASQQVGGSIGAALLNTVAVTVNANATGTLTNTASVSSTTPDPVSGNNSISETTAVDGDLVIETNWNPGHML